MKKIYGKMLLGMLIGILGALTLTLNVWGDEWYKLLASTSVGVLVGMFVTDHKTSIGVFKSVVLKFYRSIGFKNDEKSKEKRKLSFFRWLYGLTLFGVSITVIVVSVFWSFDFKLSNDAPNFYILIPAVIFSIGFCVHLSGAIDFDVHRKNMPEKFYEIWGKNVPKKFSKAIKGLSYGRVLSNMIKLGIIFFKTFISRQFLWFFKVIIPGIFAILVSCVLFIPWLIRAIGKHGHLSFVSLVIVTGSLLGTLTHSWLYGLIVIPTSLLINYTFRKVEINLGWFFKKYNFEKFPYFVQ